VSNLARNFGAIPRAAYSMARRRLYEESLNPPLRALELCPEPAASHELGRSHTECEVGSH
jgi:hypothetical protein